MAVTSNQMRDMLIAITQGLPKSQCLTPIVGEELCAAWDELSDEVEEIKSRGLIVEISWDPFDER